MDTVEKILNERYAAQPACCRKVLIELAREGRTGARNCEKGHLVRALAVPGTAGTPVKR